MPLRLRKCKLRAGLGEYDFPRIHCDYVLDCKDVMEFMFLKNSMIHENSGVVLFAYGSFDFFNHFAKPIKLSHELFCFGLRVVGF